MTMSAEHKTKIYSPSTVMVTSPYEGKKIECENP